MPDSPMLWALVVVHVALAIAFPVITRWRATPEMLREQFLTSRPGWVPALAGVGIAWIGLLLVAAVASAIAHSWAWASVAMLASALGSLVLYLARYRRVAILERQRLRAELEGSRRRASAEECDMMQPMDDETHRTAVDAARARFDAGEHRAAWDLLGAGVRAHPTVPAYRDALADLHRRVDHPDQVGRWSAHDVDRLTDRERRALRRSLVGFRSEAAVREYLVLDGQLPPIVQEHLAELKAQRIEHRGEGIGYAGHVLITIAALTLAVGLCTVGFRAFIGADDVQRVAQVYASCSAR